jgi:hypothetical protein
VCAGEAGLTRRRAGAADRGIVHLPAEGALHSLRVSEANEEPEALRAPGLRVECRGGRLVVRSGPPRVLLAIFIAGLPSMLLLWSGRWEPEAAPALFMAVAFAAAAWLVVGSWTLTLDRRKGLARLRRGPSLTRLPLAMLVGVRFYSLRQAQIERVRRSRAVMTYGPVSDRGGGVALVDTAGRWWRVTRAEDRYGHRPRRDDAEQAARLVASYLGIPFLPPYETPPGGAVPPPLEEGRGSAEASLAHHSD